MRVSGIVSGTFLVAASLGFIFLCVLFWLNRGEPKVWEYMLPAIGFGVLVPLAGTFFALQSEKSSRVIPATLFFYEQTERLVPLDMYYEHNTRLPTHPQRTIPPPLREYKNYKVAEQAMLLAEFGKIPTPEEPAAALASESVGDHQESMRRYLRILLIGFLWDLNEVFGQSWNVSRHTSNFPHADVTGSSPDSDDRGKAFAWDTIRKKLAQIDLFDSVEPPNDIPNSLSQETVFPPGTKLRFSAEDGFRARTVISNTIFTLTVEIQPRQMAKGFGEVGQLLALPSASDINAFSFEVIVDVTYHWHHIGHPQAAEHSAWVEKVIKELSKLDIEDSVTSLKHWRSYRE